MTRVFTGLAVGNVLVLLATGALGLLHVSPAPDRHVLLAVFSLLLTVFVQVLAFTYFTVTGKIVGQAVHLAGHDAAAIVEVKRLKRSVTRYLLVMLLAVILVTVTGAVHWRTNELGTLHLICAGGGLPFAGLVLLREYALIVDNTALLADAVGTYERWQGENRGRNRGRREEPDQKAIEKGAAPEVSGNNNT